jgi:hypothetical protein
VATSKLLIEAREEYRFIYDEPQPGLLMMFRSWRTERDYANDFEFNNALYIWRVRTPQ